MAVLRRHPRLHPLRPARPDRPDQRGGSAGRVAAPRRRRLVHRRVPRVGAVRLSSVHADPGRRRALRVECGRVGRGVRSGHRRDPLAAAAARADPGGGRGPGRPRRGVLVGRRRPSHLRVPQPVPLRPRRRHRRADRGLRRRRPGRPDPRRRPQRARRGEPHRRRRRGRGRGHGGRRRRQRRALARQRPRERAGLRRADRRAAVDLPRRAAARRVRCRHLGRGLAGGVGRPRGVVLPERRPRAGHRLRPAHRPHRRLLRRPPARRQPVLEQPRRPRRGHRRAGVALPNGAPRPVGVRHRRAADPGGDHGGRPPHPRRHAAEQDRVPLRLRPGHRRARLAHRGAPRAAVDGAGRAGVADAAVPDPAAAVRAPGRRRGRPHRLHRPTWRSAPARSPAASSSGRCSPRRRSSATGPAAPTAPSPSPARGARATGTPARSTPGPASTTPSPTSCRASTASPTPRARRTRR